MLLCDEFKEHGTREPLSLCWSTWNGMVSTHRDMREVERMKSWEGNPPGRSVIPP